MDYTNLWLKVKQEASDWSAECTTEKSKLACLNSSYEVESVQRSRANRVKSGVKTGSKTLSKFILGEVWSTRKSPRPSYLLHVKDCWNF